VKPTVVFLHGLARTRRSLSGLRRVVEKAGYPTWARTYPSRGMPIAELAEVVTGWIRAEVPGPLVGVTHSLGGVLARHIGPRLPWRGLVMLAPPNQGSQVARAFEGHPLFGWFFGPAGRDLVDPVGWPLPPCPFAVIAGTAGKTMGNPPSWILARHLPDGEPNDGTLAVSETRLAGMARYAEVPASHTWIMDHPEARAHILDYLSGLAATL
jgi:hypothetical protein